MKKNISLISVKVHQQKGHTHIHVHTHTHTYTYTHVHTHKCTHTYTHIPHRVPGNSVLQGTCSSSLSALVHVFYAVLWLCTWF